MSEYSAPLKEMQFALRELVDLPRLLRLPGYESVDPDILTSVLEEAGAFAGNVLSPLNVVGDRSGARYESGNVRTTQGWREAYGQFAGNGWNGLALPTAIGGHGVPAVVAANAEEMWHGANAAFALCPMLTRSAIEALEIAGGDELKQRYLPNMVAGRWTGTMVLTEPQAGSDLAAVKTQATRQSDGTYRINGQKIFITYGEHDLTDNIIHMVLARIPTAPAGVKGISLFVVPKFLVNADGSLGERNDVRCLSIEHKLGIHGSPTCVMQYGSDSAGHSQGARAWLIGQENRGLEYMFIMMNMARFSVGVQGLGLAERAYQRALQFARERRQGAEPGEKGAQSVAIIRHPDVRRMLLTMKSTIEAMRGLTCVVAEATDHGRLNPDAGERQYAQELVALLTPVVKGWCTESAIDLTSLGIQVHGGMGFIEETGAAQHLRDARITAIYEGTTGIQANDLIGRKLIRDDGQAALRLVDAMSRVQAEAASSSNPHIQAIAKSLEKALGALNEATRFVVERGRLDLRTALCAATPMLHLWGIVAGGWQQTRAALAAARHLEAREGDLPFYEARILSARFYADNILPRASGLAAAALNGAESILEIADDQF